jgi:hypothetical protein
MKYYFVLLLLALPAYQHTAAAESGLIPMQKNFVKGLFSQKRYFDAIAETRRLMAFDADTGVRADYEFFINVNYFLGGQYNTAAKNIAAQKAPLDFRDGVLLSQSYLRLGMKSLSLQTALNIRYGSADVSSRYALLARKAEAYLENGLYRELLEEISSAEPYVAERGKIAALREEVGRYRGLPFKSAPLAVALSVFIPGAGQMYAGRYLLGAASFLGVAATAGGAYYFHRRRRSDLTYTFIFISSLLYLGNIYGAFSSAHYANEEVDRSFKDTVRRKCIPDYDPAGEVRRSRIFQ